MTRKEDRIGLRTGTLALATVVATALPVSFSLGAQQTGEGSPESAQQSSQEKNQQEQKLPPEVMVLSKMHKTNQMEVKAGKLAMQKGSAEDVREYGERLMRDHQMNDDKVKKLAEEEGITLVKPEPQTQEEKKRAKHQKETMQKLQKLEGEEFDRVYLKFMVEGHEHAIKTLSKALEEKLKDPDVRELVEKSVPILQQHLELARQLRGKPAAAE